MSLPFDLEDVVGVAAAELLKRFFGMWSCLVVGWLLAMTSVFATVFAYDLWDFITGGGWRMSISVDASDLGLGIGFGFFLPLMTSFGVFYGAFLLGLVFYFFKAEWVHPYVWGAAAGVVGLSMYAAYHDYFDLWEGVIAGVFWMVEMVGLFFLLKLWLVRVRVGAEQHLMTITQENMMRREEIRARTGGAVADREFAVGDEPREG